MLFVNDIKGARYALQVSACAIYQKHEASYTCSDTNLSIWDWVEGRSEESTMALYWKTSLQMQIHILIYIRSIREADFQLHIIALRTLIKCFLL